MPTICAATSDVDTFAAKNFYIWISHFLETDISRTKFDPKSERRKERSTNGGEAPGLPTPDAIRSGLVQPTGAYTRPSGSLRCVVASVCACMTRWTRLFDALPVQNARNGTSRSNRIRHRWGSYPEGWLSEVLQLWFISYLKIKFVITKCVGPYCTVSTVRLFRSVLQPAPFLVSFSDPGN